jgi:hypothetical protein
MKIIIAIVWVWVLAFVILFMKIAKKSTPTVFEHDTEWYARACYAGNALYRGVQEVEGDDRSQDLVLFNAPSGSTLALRAKEFSAMAVLNRVTKHQEDWAESAKLLTVESLIASHQETWNQ